MGKTEKHSSQKDYATGFGGKFGVQKDRQDEVRHLERTFHTETLHRAFAGLEAEFFEYCIKNEMVAFVTQIFIPECGGMGS